MSSINSLIFCCLFSDIDRLISIQLQPHIGLIRYGMLSPLDSSSKPESNTNGVYAACYLFLSVEFRGFTSWLGNTTREQDEIAVDFMEQCQVKWSSKHAHARADSDLLGSVISLSLSISLLCPYNIVKPRERKIHMITARKWDERGERRGGFLVLVYPKLMVENWRSHSLYALVHKVHFSFIYRI